MVRSSMKKKSNLYAADVQSWLDFANYDLKTAKWNLTGKIYTSSCHASQQVAEKALKALILAKGAVIPKIHRLDRLISILKDLSVKTAQIEREAQELDQFYISTRYPGQYGGPEGLYDKHDAQSAIQAAEKILQFVQETISD